MSRVAPCCVRFRENVDVKERHKRGDKARRARGIGGGAGGVEQSRQAIEVMASEPFLSTSEHFGYHTRDYLYVVSTNRQRRIVFWLLSSRWACLDVRARGGAKTTLRYCSTYSMINTRGGVVWNGVCCLAVEARCADLI